MGDSALIPPKSIKPSGQLAAVAGIQAGFSPVIPGPSAGWHRDSAGRDLCQEAGGGGGGGGHERVKLVVRARRRGLGAGGISPESLPRARGRRIFRAGCSVRKFHAPSPGQKKIRKRRRKHKNPLSALLRFSQAHASENRGFARDLGLVKSTSLAFADSAAKARGVFAPVPLARRRR